MIRHASIKAPLEETEQRMLAGWLDSRLLGKHRLVWSHIPMGRKRSSITGAKLKREGAKAGLPDNLIFDRPPNRPDTIGVALELKRRGKAFRKPVGEQRAWLDKLGAIGWIVIVAKGAGDAIRQLRELGY